MRFNILKLQDYIEIFLDNANYLVSVSKKCITCFVTRGLNGVKNVITCLMIKMNLSPFVYFLEILIDKNKVNKKLTHKQVNKQISNVK